MNLNTFMIVGEKMFRQPMAIFIAIGMLASGCGGGEKIIIDSVALVAEYLQKCDDCEEGVKDFSGKNFNKANLSGAHLDSANFIKTNLREADLTKAYLRNADFSGASLNGANLSKSNLTKANFTNADLSGANLTEVDLAEANLKDVKLDGAIFCNTRLPDLKMNNSGCPSGTIGENMQIAKVPPVNVAQPPIKTENPSITAGTGFLFGSQDYIVTNYHVVKGTSSIKVKFLNEEIIEARIVARDTRNDVAILRLNKVPSVQTSEMRFGNSSMVRMGDKVFTIGYPSTGMMGMKPKYTEGVISSITGIKDDPTVFQTTVPIQPGNSGGPLFNENGEVVGLTTASLSTNAMNSFGAAPQNVNFAVKSFFVKNTMATVPESLLSTRGIVVTPRNTNSRADFIEKISKNVVLILGDVK